MRDKDPQAFQQEHYHGERECMEGCTMVRRRSTADQQLGLPSDRYEHEVDSVESRHGLKIRCKRERFGGGSSSERKSTR